MNLTVVAHHLALLELPPELDEALKSGRCTSPRTLHELSKLHADNPEQVQSLLYSGAEITRSAVAALRAEPEEGVVTVASHSPSNKLIAQANAACDRLERMLGRIQPSNSYKVALPELIALRIRVEDITKHWRQGSDRQTPSQAIAEPMGIGVVDVVPWRTLDVIASALTYAASAMPCEPLHAPVRSRWLPSRATPSSRLFARPS